MPRGTMLTMEVMLRHIPITPTFSRAPGRSPESRMLLSNDHHSMHRRPVEGRASPRYWPHFWSDSADLQSSDWRKV